MSECPFRKGWDDQPSKKASARHDGTLIRTSLSPAGESRRRRGGVYPLPGQSKSVHHVSSSTSSDGELVYKHRLSENDRDGVKSVAGNLRIDPA